jgi:hypothetical protein
VSRTPARGNIGLGNDEGVERRQGKTGNLNKTNMFHSKATPVTCNNTIIFDGTSDVLSYRKIPRQEQTRAKTSCCARIGNSGGGTRNHCKTGSL